MRHQLYCTGVLLVLLGLLGCAKDNGNSLQLLGVAAPNDECQFEAEPEFVRSRGVYDPRQVAGIAPSAFNLPLIVRNNMVGEAETGNEPELRPNANDATIIGFRACWMRGDIDTSSSDCSDFPGSAKVAASAVIPAGGGQQTVSVPVLTTEHLQALYGDAFDPNAIPDFGFYNGGLNYSLVSLPPDVSPRDPAWGDYPTRREADVLVRIRALARLQNGNLIQSNWLDHYIQLCVGCRPLYCDDPSVGPCPGEICAGELCPGSLVCSDGSACTAGNRCPDLDCEGDGTCLNAAPNCEVGLSGNIPATTGCFPFQSLGGCGGVLNCE